MTPYHLIAALLLMPAAEPPPGVSPFVAGPGVLVLESGQTLSGEVLRQGMRFRVEIGEGNEVYVPAENVRFHGRDLEHAYRMWREEADEDDFQQHLQLAAWCLRSGLLHRAADQYLAARRLEPENPKLHLLRQRLWSTAQRRQAVVSTATSEAAPAAELAGRMMQRREHHVQQIEEEIAPLSPELMTQFAKRVQPLLINRCSAGGCHGLNSGQQLRLLRAGHLGNLAQRYTQRNLAQVLQQLDLAAPEQSPLLTQAMKRHGNQSGPALDQQQDNQHELLRDWVLQAAAQMSGGQASAKVRPVSWVEQADGAGRNAQIRPAAYAAEASPWEPPPPASDAPRAPPPEASSPYSLEPPRLPQADAATTPDPFDPAIFNRRHHGRD